MKEESFFDCKASVRERAQKIDCCVFASERGGSTIAFRAHLLQQQIARYVITCGLLHLAHGSRALDSVKSDISQNLREKK